MGVADRMAENNDGWTLSSLYAHFSQRLEDLEELRREGATSAKTAVDAALASAKEAVIKAEQFTHERLTAHNDLQAKLDRQAQSLAAKEWVEGKLLGIEKDLRAVEERVARSEDRKAGMSLSVKILIGVVGFIATVTGIVAGLITIAVAAWAVFH